MLLSYNQVVISKTLSDRYEGGYTYVFEMYRLKF